MKTTQRTCAACNMLSQGVKFRITPPHTCDMKVVADNHQWIKDESYVVDGSFKERKVCKVCGCERLTGRGYRGCFIYSRGGMTALLHRPVCIDWNNREALNTID